MPPTTLRCERPGCTKEVEAQTEDSAIKKLELHDTQVHGSQVHNPSSKPEKPRRPQLTMPGDAVEAEDWDEFEFKYGHYKTLAGVTKDSSRVTCWNASHPRCTPSCSAPMVVTSQPKRRQTC